MVKCTSEGAGWWCYHRSLGNDYAIRMDSTAAKTNAANYWNDTTPTSTEFTLGDYGDTNGSGKTFVAYIFAHDDQSFGTNEDESIIKCGTFTRTTNNQLVDLGWEAQWVLWKRADGNSNWFLLDTMRDWNNSTDAYLQANLSAAEQTADYGHPVANGFEVNNFGLNEQHIYIAIRRPHKPPEAGTDVFHISTTAENTDYDPGFVPDLAWVKSRESVGDWYQGARLAPSNRYLAFNSDEAERTAYWVWDGPTNEFRNPVVSNTPITFALKRAPGFMDVVCYSGTGSNQNVSHGLTVAPEMMWVKRRNNNNYWAIYHSARGRFEYHEGFREDKKFDDDNFNEYWNGTSPTATQFTVGTKSFVNASGSTYLAVLFATVAGVSKVGSYNGTGSALNIDCGFTSGARLVIIKRANTVTTGSGNTGASAWFVFNSTRGIVSGNDPFLLLNGQGTEFTGDDAIDPLNSGFTVVGGGEGLNVSGGQYVFLAIA